MAKQGKRNKSINWLYLAAGCTVMYVMLIVLWSSSTVDPRLDGRTACGTGHFFSAWFGCLTLNELGDYLAGAFAPLAFMWLAAAVLIQSRELKAQQDILDETRKELVESRMVMKAQVAESKKQAEFIGQQTKILEREQALREEAANIRVFQKAVGILANHLREHPQCFVFLDERNQANSRFNISLNHVLEQKVSDPELVRAFSTQLQARVNLDVFPRELTERKHHLQDPNGFQEVYLASTYAWAIGKDLGSEGLMEAERLGVRRIDDAFSQVPMELKPASLQA